MAWDNKGFIKGPKGDQGPIGQTGSRGPQGNQGTQGPKGDNILVWSGTASQYDSVDKNAYDLYLVKA
jgi:hypothetical protein